MKKTLIYLTGLVLTGLLLTGCAGKKEEATPTPAPTATSTPTPTWVPTPTPTPFEEVSLEPLAPVTELSIPQNSSEISYEFANQLLTLCSGGTAEKTTEYFNAAGFTVLLQKNFDKADSSAEHTSAYTVGVKTIVMDGELRPVYLLAVRGTNAGEWYSNFDVAPSHNADTVFAENFLYTAEDALAGLNAALQTGLAGLGADGVDSGLQPGNPVFIVTGHSRGAATANLLGMLLDRLYPEENVYTYTFATPATVREGFNTDNREYGNIFNFINPCDIVPRLPLEGWGFGRVGKDIILRGDSKTVKEMDESVNSLLTLAPDLSAYYKDKHSLTKPGLSDDGMTTFDMMLMLAKSFVTADLSNLGNDSFTFNPVGDMGSSLENTDFAILFTQFGKLSDESGKYKLLQHMPSRYFDLIKELETPGA